MAKEKFWKLGIDLSGITGLFKPLPEQPPQSEANEVEAEKVEVEMDATQNVEVLATPEVETPTWQYIFEVDLKRDPAPDHTRLLEIDNSSEFFFGECGLGLPFISLSGSEGAVLEAWIFDKQDVRTTSVGIIPPQLSERFRNQFLPHYRSGLSAQTGEMKQFTTPSFDVTMTIISAEPHPTNKNKLYKFKLQVDIKLKSDD